MTSKKEAIKKLIKNTKVVVAKPEYVLELKINGVSHSVETDNIDESLMALKPDIVLIESYVTIKSSAANSTRKVTMANTRKLFNDSIYREIFINNLLVG